MNTHKHAGGWLFFLLLLLIALAQTSSAQQAQVLVTPDAVLEALNTLRADPAAYAARLEARRSWYRGRELRQPGSGVVVMTAEGLKALDEAIDVLKAQPALLRLKASTGIARAARDHARDLVRGRFESHTGSDGSTPDTRMMRYGTWQGSCGEAINFARSMTADDIIIDLLVDDGVSDRSHRILLLNAAMASAGVAITPHPKYGTLCVIDMAEGYEEGKQAHPIKRSGR